MAMAVSLDEDEDLQGPLSPPPRTDGLIIEPKMPSFDILDAVFMIISMLTFIVDIVTDVSLAVQYYLSGYIGWTVATLVLVIVPAIVVSIFSLNWHLMDRQKLRPWHWISHVILCPLFQRYVEMFGSGLNARKTKDKLEFEILFHQRSDVCLLRIFESFMESAPQLILQLYIMKTDEAYSIWTAITAISSLVSLSWGIAAYTKAQRNTRKDKHKMTWTGLILQTFWRIGMIAARISSITLATIILGPWILLVMGIHFVCMYIWVMIQKTNFGRTWWEERLFNLVMAMVYCFCFFNLEEGKSRWRMTAFYTIVFTENISFGVLYYFYGLEDFLKPIALGFIIGSMILGLCSMVIYYRFFHPMGPLNIKSTDKVSDVDVEKGITDSSQDESNDKDSSNASSISFDEQYYSRLRNLKYHWQMEQKDFSPQSSSHGSHDEINSASDPDINNTNNTSEELTEETTNESNLQPYLNTGIMCSVQDLLANMSCTSLMVPSPQKEVPAQNKEEVDNTYDTVHCTPMPVTNVRNNLYDSVTPSSLERSLTREFEMRISGSCIGKSDVAASHTSEFEEKSSDASSVTSRSDNASPNNLGIPYSSNCDTAHLVRQNSGTIGIMRAISKDNRSKNSEVDFRIKAAHITTSMVNCTERTSSPSNLSFDQPIPVQTLGIPTLDLTPRNDSPTVQCITDDDYESIYDPPTPDQNAEIKTSFRKENPIPPLPSKPLFMHLMPLNIKASDGVDSHDYENLPSININRAVGVRHWRTYSDILDSAHEFSTNKDRIKQFDSTIASNINSECTIYKSFHIYSRPGSLADASLTTLSRSLPDLSHIKLETCVEMPEEGIEDITLKLDSSKEISDENRLINRLNYLRSNCALTKSNSVDDIPNYETIWVGDIDVEKVEDKEVSSQLTWFNNQSSLVTTIGDLHNKESLCNLYYSTTADLSSRYFIDKSKNISAERSNIEKTNTEDLPENHSIPEQKSYETSQKLNTEEEKKIDPQLGANEARSRRPLSTDDILLTPLGTGQVAKPRRKFSILRDKFEGSNRTPLKSPIAMYFHRRRSDSLQDRSVKSFCKGIRMFNRPRVHAITPMDSPYKDTPKIKSPFKSKTNTPIGITPNIKAELLTKTMEKTDPVTGTVIKRTPLPDALPSSYKTIPRPKTMSSAEKINQKMMTPINKKNSPVTNESNPGTSYPQENKNMCTPADRMLIKKTPKTSTPDQAKSTKSKIKSGPKHSTPENLHKQLPQISILSQVSSVASPDSIISRTGIYDMPSQLLSFDINRKNVLKRAPLAENINCLNVPQRIQNPDRMGQNRSSAKNIRKLNSRVMSMSVIKEVETPDKRILQSNMELNTLQENLEYYPSRYDDEVQGGRISLSSYGLNTMKENIQYTTPYGSTLGLANVNNENTRTALISITQEKENTNSSNVSIRGIVLPPPRSPNFNQKKSTLSPTSKIFARKL